jgi:hypothetical protein
MASSMSPVPSGVWAVGQTSTVGPDFSGWKHSGMVVGLRKPMTATPAASRVMNTAVATRTLRKLRTRSCSRSADELVEQAGHLTKHVVGRGGVQQVRLGGIEVAHRALDPRPAGVAQRPAPLVPRRLPSSLKVQVDGLRQVLASVPLAHPGAQ